MLQHGIWMQLLTESFQTKSPDQVSRTFYSGQRGIKSRRKYDVWQTLLFSWGWPDLQTSLDNCVPGPPQSMFWAAAAPTQLLKMCFGAARQGPTAFGDKVFPNCFSNQSTADSFCNAFQDKMNQLPVNQLLQFDSLHKPFDAAQTICPLCQDFLKIV